jgi:hypothetical protein
MSATTWTKFYWADWGSDPALRLCSLAAQGLWMRMLCVAAEAQPRGYVTVNGVPLDSNDIARIAGETKATVDDLLSELEKKGVFSRDRRGCIYSRRMVRDEKIAEKNEKNGKKGGNPSLRKQTQISDWDNPPDKPGDKAHMPIANSHKPIVARTEPAESLPRARDPEDVGTPPPSQPVTNRDRVTAADLLDRGKAELSPWETKFLTDMIGRAAMNGKQRATFDAIAAKIGTNMAEVMATWRKRMEAARHYRQWDPKWGPRPHAPGCIAPSELLDPDDGDGWTDWQPDRRATA